MQNIYLVIEEKHFKKYPFAKNRVDTEEKADFVLKCERLALC